MAYGGKQYGTFYHHGNEYDFGIKPHGTPASVHSHYESTAPYDADKSTHAFQKKPAAYHNPQDTSYGTVGTTMKDFEFTVPEVHYPTPHGYSYSAVPTIQYVEVEHIPPTEYETPVPNIHEHIYPEGYTNEYDDFYLEDYYGSDG